MSPLRYLSGDEVRAGDRIRFHGEDGTVEFVVLERVGDPTLDWHLEQHPEGGLMIIANSFGRVFLTPVSIDERLELVTHKEA